VGPEQVGGNDDALDLVGALVDFGDALVALAQLDPVVAAVTQRAVDLHGPVDTTMGDI